MRILLDKRGKRILTDVNDTIPAEAFQYKLSFINAKTYNFNSCTNNIIHGDHLFRYHSIGEITGSLPVLTSGSYMFANNFNSNGPLKSITLDMPNLVTAQYMVSNNPNLEKVTINAPKLEDATYFFNGCSNLKVANISFPSLTIGKSLFYSCEKLESVDLSQSTKMNNCEYMFYHCYALKYFNLPDLSHITSARSLFATCKSITNADIDLSSTTNASYAFYKCSSIKRSSAKFGPLTELNYLFTDCKNLEIFDGDMSLIDPNTEAYCKDVFRGCDSLHTFNSDLTNLRIGGRLFTFCYSLENFSGKLTSLQTASEMFRHCKLNYNSVTNILNSIIYENQYAPTEAHVSILTLGVNSEYKEEVMSYLLQENATNTTSDDRKLTANITTALGTVWDLEIYWN